ncbi:MAG: hypothetical protein DCC67_13645 [Planctomycetota bacterium]|nr:MAG: hypothetical protein DCC67_13645 [Planctomycetota bacterium]
MCFSVASSRAQDHGVGRRSPIGTNVAGVGPFATQWDFVDLMKGANPWVYDGGPKAGQPAPVDALGNPLLQPGEKANTLLRLKLVDATQRRIPDYPAGQYTITWEGSGQFALSGDGDYQYVTAGGPGSRTFTAATGHDTLFLRIDSSPANNRLRNIRVLMPGYGPGEAGDGQPFHQVFLDRTVKPFGSLRFMDWANANGTTHNAWSQRTRDRANQYTVDAGVPIEQQLRLASRSQGDVWFCMPARASDDYVTKFAQAALYGIDAAGNPYTSAQANPAIPPVPADRKIYVEYANEVWNRDFEGFKYVTQQALAAGLNPQGLDQDFAKQWAAEMRRDFDAWKAVFNAAHQGDRIRRVAAIQAGNRFISPILLKELTAGGAPQFDVISPAFYVGVDSGAYDASTTKDKIIDDLFAGLEAAVDPRMTTFLPGTPFQVRGPAGDWLLWKQFADQYGVELIAYEGGQHVTTGSYSVPWYDDYMAAQRDPRMYDFYSAWLEAIFETVGADGVSVFSSVAPISQWGAWGYLEFQDQPDAEAPKYRAIMDYARARGDFDLNGWYNAADIDMLRAAAGTPPTGDRAMFDLNDDGMISEQDVEFLVQHRLGATIGDFNLDGRCDGGDLGDVLANYGRAGDWRRGDANGDGRTDGSDLLLWQRHASFGDFAAAGLAVPEPRTLTGSAALFVACLINGGHVRDCLRARQAP